MTRPIVAQQNGQQNGYCKRDQLRLHAQAEIPIEVERFLEVDDADVGHTVDHGGEGKSVQDVLQPRFGEEIAATDAVRTSRTATRPPRTSERVHAVS